VVAQLSATRVYHGRAAAGGPGRTGRLGGDIGGARTCVCTSWLPRSTLRLVFDLVGERREIAGGGTCFAASFAKSWEKDRMDASQSDFSDVRRKTRLMYPV
jgi:hypothetical protein